MPGTPSQGAASLALAGTLAFKIAKERKDFTAEKVALLPARRWTPARSS